MAQEPVCRSSRCGYGNEGETGLESTAAMGRMAITAKRNDLIDAISDGWVSFFGGAILEDEKWWSSLLVKSYKCEVDAIPVLTGDFPTSLYNRLGHCSPVAYDRFARIR